MIKKQHNSNKQTSPPEDPRYDNDIYRISRYCSGLRTSSPILPQRKLHRLLYTLQSYVLHHKNRHNNHNRNTRCFSPPS